MQIQILSNAREHAAQTRTEYGLLIALAFAFGVGRGLPFLIVGLFAGLIMRFAALARRPGRIFTRAQLLDAVRGADVDAFERAIDTHVKNIRRKIEPDPRSPKYILTVYGMGYKFAE